MVEVSRELTNFTISEDQVVSPNNMSFTGVPKDLRYYPSISEDKIDVLCREYLINKFTITTPGSILIDPMRQLIFGRTGHFPETILKRFKYWRSELQIRIQLVCPVQTYGYLMGCWYPRFITSFDHLRNQYGLSGFTLAFSDQESIVIDCPWVLPINSYDTQAAFYNDALYEFGTLVLETQSIATMVSGETPNVEVYVYAALKDPVLYAPIASYTPVESNYELHMLQEAVNVGIEQATNYFQFRGTSNVIKDFTTLYETVKSWTDEDASEDKAPESKKKKKNQTDGSSVRQAVYGDLSTLNSAKGAVCLGDYPTNVLPDDRQIVDRIKPDILDRIKRFQPISHFEALVATTSIFPVCPEQYGPINGSVISPAYVDSLFNVPEITMFASMFRYWRGTIKFRLQMFVPSLVSARVRIYYFPSPSYFSPTGIMLIPDNELVGDMWSEVITVRGTTEHVIEVPYIRNHTWDSIGDGSKWGYFGMRVLSIQPSTVTPLVLPVLISVAAGDDFMFKGFTGGSCDNLAAPPPVPLRKKYSLHGKFSTSTATVSNVAGSTIRPLTKACGAPTDMYMLAQRFGELSEPVFATNYPLSGNFTREAWAALPPVYKFAHFFSLYTGEVDYKILFDGGDDPMLYLENKTRTYGLTSPTITYAARSVASTSVDLWRTLDVRIPMYYELDYAYTGWTPVYFGAVTEGKEPAKVEIASFGTTSPVIRNILQKGGENFRFEVSMAIPKILIPVIRLHGGYYDQP